MGKGVAQGQVGPGSVFVEGYQGIFALLGLAKELSPDSIFKAPLILKLDNFWFTRLFIFVAGFLWALFGCGVACLGETSGLGGCRIPGMC